MPKTVLTTVADVSGIGRVCRLRARTSRVAARRYSCLWELCKDESGAVAVIAGLALTTLIGFVGLAVDLSMWYRTNRALQNAADASVIAAAQNGTGTYRSEAKAVAAQYGFVDGTNGITVTALNNQTCPNGETDCYMVTVAQSSAPLFFSGVLGISAPALSGAAMASGAGTQINCLLSLAGLPGHSTSEGIRTNGAGHADLTGCRVMSNNDMTCHGHDLNATYGDAHGTNNGCGGTQRSSVPQVADPYTSLATNIPSNTCSLYPQEPSPLITNWSGSRTLATLTTVCGDLKLTGNTTLTTATNGSVLLIRNGRLDTNGYTLATDASSSLTIIFSGPDLLGTYTHSPTSSGTLDFKAPTSGTWSGLAIYQDPALTAGVDISYSGHDPTWNITGVVYLPHSYVQFSGAVNKSSYGANCFLFVVDRILISGTANIAELGECPLAGVTLPTVSGGGIALVQ